MSARITLLNGSAAKYPVGGGHLSVRIQYILGLQELGYQVNWLAPLAKSNSPNVDRQRIRIFLRRAKHLGLEGRAGVLLYGWSDRPITCENVTSYGIDAVKLRQIIADTDLALNLCHSVSGPLLDMFSRTALVDLDPGHLQIGGETTGCGIQKHDAYLTVGLNMNATDCTAPHLNHRWHPVLPPIYLKMWDNQHPPRANAPLTSITQWTWSTLRWKTDRLSVSKRDAYLRFIDAPQLCDLPFELAANIHPNDNTGDKALLERNGWRLTHPHRVARSPSHYRAYIKSSIGEFGCAKPIHAALRTGWFSDRTAAYLASGRPAIVEDTGFSGHVPTGMGLLTFRDAAGISQAADELLRDWRKHATAAREFAYAFLDHRRVLPAILEKCFSGDN